MNWFEAPHARLRFLASRLAWLGGLSIDSKLALRMLVKHPGLTVVAVVGMSVAVAIGAVSFSAIDAIVDGELPMSEGGRVVAIQNIDSRSNGEGRRTHLHDLATWREALSTLQELGAYRMVDRNIITLDGRSETARIAEMTASGFRIARIPPLIGRYFHDDDERAGAAAVVVIGYDVWQTRFTARPDVVGQTIQLGDTRHTVIGVMPKGFAFPINNRVWTPLRLNPAEYERGRAPGIEVFGRVAPAATLAAAQRQATTIAQRLSAAYPESHGRIRTSVLPYTEALIAPSMAWPLHLVQVLVSMLLVVIGTNVAILVYARTAGRMGEIAIRTALGASRGRIVAQLFAEAFALSIIAAAVGIVGAYVALRQIDAVLTRLGGEQIPFWWQFGITPGVITYAGGMAVIGAVIVGVAPALKATRHQVHANLQQLSSGNSGMRLGKTWTFLIVVQVTVAVAILPVAIFGLTAWKVLDAAESKLATKEILTATLFLDRPELAGQRLATKRSVLGKIATLGTAAPDSVQNRRDFAARYLNLRAELVTRLRAEPGVTAVVFASNPPGSEQNTRIEVDANATSIVNADAAPGSGGAVVSATRVDGQYFAAFDIPILAGRPFQSGDFSATTTAVVVNRAFARKLLGDGNPLGRRVRVATRRGGAKADASADWEQIVGVISDFPADSSASAPKIYRPLSPADVGPVTIGVRVKGVSLAAFAGRLREVTVSTNPMLRLEQIKPVDQTLAEANVGGRLTILTLELVTMSTVLLSAAGIYALMAFTITRRRREIGIRSALGAGPWRVIMSVLSRSLAQVGTGIVIGIGLAAVLDRAMEGGWTGGRATLVLPAVVALMAVVGFIAAIGPASRALRIQPTEALRSE